MTDDGPADVTGALLARKGAASPAGFKDPPARPPQRVAQEPKRTGSRKLLLWIIPAAIVAVGATLTALSIQMADTVDVVADVAVDAPLEYTPAKTETPVIHETTAVSDIKEMPEPSEPKRLAALELVPVIIPTAEPIPAPPSPKTKLDKVAVKVAVKTSVKIQMPAAATPVYRVQLHALRSRASARREWRKIKKSHDDLFGQKQMTLLSDENKASGIRFVRLQAGPFNGFRAARNLCSQARKRRLACVVVQQ